MSKLRLGLVQAQASYGENTYIPFAVGCMWATARQYPEIRECWDDPIFVYRKEPIDKALAVLGYPLPDVVAFSNYCWSWLWNKALARAIKELSPRTVIVFGGVHVPDNADDFFKEDEEWVADFLIHGEGEGPFTEFLRQWSQPDNQCNYDKVPSLSHWSGIRNKREFAPLDVLKSPYLEGVFDSIYRKEGRLQALWETDRGCPFACT